MVLALCALAAGIFVATVIGVFIAAAEAGTADRTLDGQPPAVRRVLLLGMTAASVVGAFAVAGLFADSL